MALGYLMKEGFSGFRRARLAMLAAIFTVMVALLLLSSFTIFFMNANSVIEALRTRVAVEAFLRDDLTGAELDSLGGLLAQIPGVESVRFISKEEAAEIFLREFGEDIHRVLRFNPLPASYTIALNADHRTALGASAVADSVRSFAGVEEVVYRKDLLEMLDQRVRFYLGIALGVGLFILLASVFLVANTIRLAIYAKRKIIQTMKLIGATPAFIRFPFILEGLVQGFLGGLLAAGVLFAVFEALRRWATVQLQDLVQVEPLAYVAIVVAGGLLGFLGSAISIRRFIGESVTS